MNNVHGEVPAIVLGCHKIGLGIIRALGEKNVPVVGVYYNDSDMGYVSKYISSRHRAPNPDMDADGFVSFLIDLASQWAGAVLIPSDDATLIPVSRRKDLLNNYYRVAAPDWEVTRTCIDKRHTYALAERIGVPAPRTAVVNKLEEARDFISVTGFPCLLKPSVGHIFFEHFRKKMLFIENIAELEKAFRIIEKLDMKMMLQEFIPGDDTHGVNYNSFFVAGEPALEFTAAKIRLSPPATGFPRVVVSKHIPDVLAPGRKMLRALKYTGFSCMEFKRDERNGVFKLMEINSRLNLSTSLSVRSYENMPYLTYMHSLCGHLPSSCNTMVEGIYWIDPGKDIFETLRSFRRERMGVRNFIHPYLRPHVFTVPSIRDPLPMLKRIYDIVVKAVPRCLAKWSATSPTKVKVGALVNKLRDQRYL